MKDVWLYAAAVFFLISCWCAWKITRSQFALWPALALISTVGTQMALLAELLPSVLFMVDQVLVGLPPIIAQVLSIQSIALVGCLGYLPIATMGHAKLIMVEPNAISYRLA